MSKHLSRSCRPRPVRNEMQVQSRATENRVQAVPRPPPVEVRPLSLACANGNTELVELLLKAGAGANTTLPGGETVLMTAARTGRIGAVRALLAHKADVNAKERKGQTAMIWAAAEGHAGRGGRTVSRSLGALTPAPAASNDRSMSTISDGSHGLVRYASHPPRPSA